MLYAEDLSPGLEFRFSTWTISEQEILDYARCWDPQPIHTDPSAAQVGSYGGVIASGLHTMAIYQRLAVEAMWSQVAGIAGSRFEVRMRRPVRPGTTLTGGARVEQVTPQPERGAAVVVVAAQLVDGEDRVMLDIVTDVLIATRRAAEPA